MPLAVPPAFTYDPERAEEIMSLEEREAITDHRLLYQSLAVLAVVIAAFVLHPVLHYEASVVALLGAGLLVATTRVTTEQALEEVEWPTLIFFAGLFVMVGGLVETGVIGDLSPAAGSAMPRCCCCGRRPRCRRWSTTSRTWPP